MHTLPTLSGTLSAGETVRYLIQVSDFLFGFIPRNHHRYPTHLGLQILVRLRSLLRLDTLAHQVLRDLRMCLPLLPELGLDLLDLGRGHHCKFGLRLPVIVFEFRPRVLQVFVSQASTVRGRDHPLEPREVELPEAVIGPLQPAGHRVPLVEAGRRVCALPDVRT